MTRGSLFRAAVLGAAVLGACTPPEAPDGPPVPSRLHEMDSDLAKRIEERVASVREKPVDADRWFQLGLIYEAHEVYSSALETYERVVDMDPDNPRALYHLALMQSRAGDPSSAIVTLQRVSELEDYAPAWWRRGFLLLDLGRVDDAEAAFADALRVAPGSTGARAGLARVALERRDPRRAIAIVESLLEEGVRQPHLHHLLGIAHRQLEQWDQAEFHLTLGRESRAVWPDLWGHEALTQRVEFYVRLEEAIDASDRGHQDVAIPVLEELAARKPDDRRALSGLSRAYLRVGRHREGLDLLERLRELYPEHFEVEMNLATAHEHLGDLPRALTHAERSIELNPDYAPVYRRKGSILGRQGRWREAADAYERAVRLAPNDGHAWKLLGECRVRLGQWELAAGSLSQALQLEPEDATSWTQLGFALMRLGDGGGAESALARAVELAPEDPTARLVLDQVRRQPVEAAANKR